jgi:tRNA threonylcarbamoyladenosine biosynthesis protein TsaE
MMQTMPVTPPVMNHYETVTEAETLRVGEDFAGQLRAGDVVACYGDLGAGKTRFIQGVCRGLGVREHVTSPTFTILNEYASGSLPVFHFDFYRIATPAELRDIGAREYFEGGEGVCLIEWAEKVAELLPPVRYEVRLALGRSSNERSIDIRGIGKRGAP